MSQPVSPQPSYDSLYELVTQRLYWFFIGPMFLILMLLGIVNDDQGREVYFSIAYVVALALLPVSRWLEIRTGRAVAADGCPAPDADLRNYTLTAIACGLIALILAHVWAHFAK